MDLGVVRTAAARGLATRQYLDAPLTVTLTMTRNPLPLDAATCRSSVW